MSIDIDFSQFSGSELIKLSQLIDKEIALRAGKNKANVLRDIQKLVTESGLSLAELFPGVELPKATRRGRKPGSTNKLAGTKIAVKYRHPDNAELEWTGRGRAPKWVEAWKANGGTIEQLAV